MKMHWIAAGLVAVSSFANAQVRNPNALRVRGGVTETSPFNGAQRGGSSASVAATSQQSLAQLVGGSDDCATAEVISGTGAFAFNNAAATTGLTGQVNTGCNFWGSMAISLDVWFAWTAPANGLVILSNCNQSPIDTKIAVYDKAAIGNTCPANNQAVTVLACNDDVSDFKLESRCLFTATAGKVYLIQLGTSPVATTPGGAAGTFTIEYDPQPDATPCTNDDGNADARLRFSVGNTEQAVLQGYGKPGDVTLVNNILVSYGAFFGAANSALANGTPVKVFVYDDPTDDYDLADATLVQLVNSTVQNRDTDAFNTVPLSPPVTVNGVFFVGWAITSPAVVPANFYPFAYDMENCDALPGDGWAMWNAGGAINFNTPASNSQPPGYFLPVNGVQRSNLCWMVRPDCATPTPGTPFCSGDGSLVDHTTPCPCGNNGAAGNGCAHSFSSAGANLTAGGATQTDDVVLHATNEPATSFTLFLQHNAPGDGVFHDGVLCAGGTLIRLRGRAAVAGEAFFPNNTFAQDSTTTLSQRGGVVAGSGAVRYYSAWFRNASTTFCPPATANVSNGWQITW